ncbi:MAG: phosphoglycolate phosphatase [Burkholderiales bacterium]|jgi:phosphoglycolate phosphatase|nr:phosphoglycolate phosphatase [Burkholderiales bacterium]
MSVRFPQRCDAVLFDLDGTLMHTVPDLAAAVNAMLSDLGRAHLPQATVADYVGKGAENLVHRSLTGSLSEKAPGELFERAYEGFKHHYDRINGLEAQFYEGVLEGLDALQAMGLRLAVVTNKPARYTLPLLERSGLMPRFSAVVSGDTCERKKPDAMPIAHACAQLGVEASAAVMIGDSLNDAQAAKAAGSVCWLLPYGYNEGRAILETPCDGYVQTIAQAAELLRQQRGAT